MNMLQQIISDKHAEIAGRKALEPLHRIKEKALAQDPAPPFIPAVLARPVGLIAEVKRRSPSAGDIRAPFDVAAIARSYAAAGAQAISCLLDEKYFGGGADDFRMVREIAGLPMLYKEFVVDPWQVWHARELRASAVLLIAGALPLEELRMFVHLVREAGMTPLVEVHDIREADAALECSAELIGVNNRDLRNFQIRIETTELVAAHIGADAVIVSESGLRTPADILRVKAAGCRAVLVGEQLLRQDDPARAVQELMGDAWASL